MNELTEIARWLTGHPAAAAVAGVLILALAWMAARAVRRMLGRLLGAGTPEDVLTVIAASIATAVAMTGMWKFFGDVLHFSGPLRVLLFAFVEVAVFTSALRARRNVTDPDIGTAGVDGAAVWVLTCLSALLSAMDAGSAAEAVFRLAAPLVAAWLWERSMAVERRRATGRTSRIHWRITPERILVRLGLAEASDRTASQVDAHRRLAKLALAAKKLRHLRAADAWEWRQRRASRRLDKAMAAAVEHADLTGDAVRRDALLGQLAALYNTTALAELTPPTPWTYGPTRTDENALRMVDARTGPDRTDRDPRTDVGRTDPDARTGQGGTDDGSRRGDGQGRTDDGRRDGEESPAGEAANRDVVVAELAAEILAAADADEKWAPDYKKLIKDTHRSRSWCEKAVRAARDLALRTDARTDKSDHDAASDAHTVTRTDARTERETPPQDVDRTDEGSSGTDSAVVVQLARTGGER